MLKKLAALVASAGLVMTVACAKTDAGITTNVKTRLAADETVKAYQINVDTANGVVTLTGTVENPAAKEQAIIIARQTSGVTNVVDQITVNRAEATSGENIADRTGDAARSAAEKTEDFAKETADKTEDLAKKTADKTEDLAKKTGEVVTDAAITSAVKTKMLADPTVKGLKIDVDTNNGVVTLNGDVTSKAEMDKATMIARDTKGVSRVVSNLHVK
jgi:hyperosmotically inducible protein